MLKDARVWTTDETGDVENKLQDHARPMVAKVSHPHLLNPCGCGHGEWWHTQMGDSVDDTPCKHGSGCICTKFVPR